MYSSIFTKLMMLTLALFYRQRSRGADLDWGHLAAAGGGCLGIELRSADAVALILCNVFLGVIKIISASWQPHSDMDKSTKKLRVSSRWWPGGPLVFSLPPPMLWLWVSPPGITYGNGQESLQALRRAPRVWPPGAGYSLENLTLWLVNL